MVQLTNRYEIEACDLSPGYVIVAVTTPLAYTLPMVTHCGDVVDVNDPASIVVLPCTIE